MPPAAPPPPADGPGGTPASRGDAGAHRAKRSLGQNFLVDPTLQRRIVAALEAEAHDVVVEIGPGRGALTRHLAGCVRRLVLVELDDVLAGALAGRHADDPSVDVIHGDVLKTDLPAVVDRWGEARVIGNIPYNITTPILFHLLRRPRPREIVVMVQREVAQRIVAAPGTRAYGALAVGVQSVASARLLFGVPRRAFRPTPRVESAVVRVTPHQPPRISASDELRLRHLTRAAFQWRRKQLGRILRSHPDLAVPEGELARVAEALDLDLERRPETLSPGAMLALARALPIPEGGGAGAD
ncbi:MAG: 16S rRNA (adenine(1518)-N(6)/adenine(1519)-N(6))-dimethyltransferase RsmA [Longimicrobiales bacterium]|nr:16S rRNA (adenine(1518)-N(6)/adenine(1519)-N(6))-dimethyltransferase RsmA [Longimicrobiales bacterium]